MLEAHALRASQGGFSAIFLPDHHFNGYMPMASDSFIFAAYLAAKMPHMHFGFSVVSVPLHHPVRFAERINILDQLTDGKLLVGVGIGHDARGDDRLRRQLQGSQRASPSATSSSPSSSGPSGWRTRRSRSTTVRTRAACSSASRPRPTRPATPG